MPRPPVRTCASAILVAVATVAQALACAGVAASNAPEPRAPRFAEREVGAPSHAAAASPYDALWTGYPLPNVVGTVYAMVPFAGGMAMGGDVRYWGTTLSNRVALWDGASWQPLGDGVPGVVRALAVYDGKLIAGCETDGRVYAWDGTSWTLIGDADNPVRSLLVDGTDLYVGGSFFSINGVTATFLARWDGATWHDAGTNLNRPRQSGGGIYPLPGVRSLVRVGPDLYAGGQLPGYEGIARWDGLAWSTTGAGLQNGANAATVDALATDGTTLYASGTFNSSGGSGLTRIAAWNGSSWSGLPGATVASSALAMFGGQLVGTVPDAGVSRPQFWNGTSWNPFNHPNVIPQGYGSDGSSLYASGSVSQGAGSTPTDLGGFQRFDGSAWSPVQQAWESGMKGVSGLTYDAVEWDGALYVGGVFFYPATGSGYLFSIGVTRWDGSNWTAVPSLGGQHFDLHVHGDSLYASVNGVVRVWNGSSWRKVAATQSSGDTFDMYGNALGSYQGGLYVFGPFTRFPDMAPLGGVAHWTGSEWEPLGPEFDPSGWLAAGLEWNSKLVIGGSFASAGGQPIRNLAIWNGSAIQELGGGADWTVSALATLGGDLVVGGGFTEIGGDSIRAIARWDGASWHAMGTRARQVDGLESHSGRLYAIGVFAAAGGSDVRGVAVWTGADWLLLGSGVDPNGRVEGLGFLGDDLYLLGGFNAANGHPARNFAKLANVSTLGVDPPAPHATRLALAPSPNPSRGGVRLSVTLPAAGRVRLVIHDVSGREVARLLDGEHAAGAFSIAWDARVAPGLYFATLESAGKRTTTRVVRLQ